VSGKGTRTIDFGSGATTAEVDVDGQSGIDSESHCEAFFQSQAGVDETADHNADEHALAPHLMTLSCAAVVAGSGFTIKAISLGGAITGQWVVRWVWA